MRESREHGHERSSSGELWRKVDYLRERLERFREPDALAAFRTRSMVLYSDQISDVSTRDQRRGLSRGLVDNFRYLNFKFNNVNILKKFKISSHRLFN